MSEDVIRYSALPLTGDKVSIASPSVAVGNASLEATHAGLTLFRALIGCAALACEGAASLCGAVCLWAAPALLLYRYGPDQILDALARAPLRGTPRNLLVLFATLAYFVATGLMVGSVTARLASRLGRQRVVLRVAVAPLIFLSLAATAITAVPFFLGVLVLCFPSLL
ncbi:MAG TPA: hypothetical protein VGZ72_13990 [Stellaceae bacterium]|jgi:hypothetical protein|nr:hypothetical protein [Stellaceae bacterium]